MKGFSFFATQAETKMSLIFISLIELLADRLSFDWTKKEPLKKSSSADESCEEDR